MMKNSLSSRMIVSPWLIYMCLVCLLAVPAVAQETLEEDLIKTDVDVEGMFQDADNLTDVNAEDNRVLSEEEIVALNRNLKNAIGENQRLLEERRRMEEEFNKIKSQLDVELNRSALVTAERDSLTRRAAEFEAATLKAQQDIQVLKEQMESIENQPNQKAESKEEFASADLTPIEPQQVLEVTTPHAPAEVYDPREPVLNPLGLQEKVSRLNAFNEQLKLDAAKVHYNLGNMYFRKGEYRKAKQEYEASLNLVPDDASTHYNLAFVSSEYLKDQKTALEHYRSYLHLNPNAEDVDLVREKILAAELTGRTKIDANVDPLKRQELREAKELKKKAQALRKKQAQAR